MIQSLATLPASCLDFPCVSAHLHTTLCSALCSGSSFFVCVVSTYSTDHTWLAHHLLEENSQSFPSKADHTLSIVPTTRSRSFHQSTTSPHVSCKWAHPCSRVPDAVPWPLLHPRSCPSLSEWPKPLSDFFPCSVLPPGAQWRGPHQPTAQAREFGAVASPVPPRTPSISQSV